MLALGTAAWSDAANAEDELEERPRTRIRTFRDLFLHGFLFSVLLAAFEIGFSFVFAVLFAIGLWLGVALGLALLVYVVGWLNAAITRLLWFPVRKGVGATFLPGLVVHVLFTILGVVAFLLFMVVPGFLSPAVAVLVMSPVYGYVGRRVASVWREVPDLAVESEDDG